MAHYHQGEKSGHRRFGHAAAGHAAKQKFDRHADCGYRVAAIVLCGADRTRIHSPAAGRGNCGGQGKGRAIRSATQEKTRKFQGLSHCMAGQGDFRA